MKFYNLLLERLMKCTQLKQAWRNDERNNNNKDKKKKNTCFSSRPLVCHVTMAA